MKSTFVIFGMPGVGKGTRLSKFLNGREADYQIVSVGNMLRAARKAGTEIGLKAASYMDSGALVPDEIVNAAVIEGMKGLDVNLITDGFPRTVNQAKAMIEADVVPTVIIELQAPEDVILDRALNRIVCEDCGEAYTLNDYHPPKETGICDKCGGKLIQRHDDEPETVKARLDIYHEETEPLKGFYAERGLLRSVDDRPTVAETSKGILDVLGR